MSRAFDVIVVGVGGMGSAACYHLARRGARVLGLERFDIGHAMGSSHGLTRILRLAYFEGSFYVPMVLRARELWQELGEAAGERIFFETGALDLAPQGAGIVEASLQSCLDHGLAHEALDGAAIARRFPALSLPSNHVGLLQPGSGFVASERAILAHAGLAIAAGAEIRAREAVLEITAIAGGGVRVRTDKASYEAGRAIVAPGAWIGRLVPSLDTETTVVRRVQAWFAPRRPAELSPDRLPVFTLKVDEGHFYGFPLWGHPGFKLGGPHYGSDVVDPELPTREPTPEAEAALRECAARYVPAGAGETLALRACLYTMTRDEHFIVDTLPGQEEIIVASPCSGHGYKFASAMGEILADLATIGASRFDLSPFSITRVSKVA
jgi:sarcosine oxidase